MRRAEGQYFYHVVATNWLEEKKNTEKVLKWRNQRGQAENFSKELKIELGMERMPCGQGYANGAFFRIGVIAYNLFIGFKRLACPESWMKQTIGTFRWKRVQVASRIVRHAGKVVLKLMTDLEKLELFRGIRRKSFELSVCPDGWKRRRIQWTRNEANGVLYPKIKEWLYPSGAFFLDTG